MSSIILWIVSGLLVGFIVSRIVADRRSRTIVDLSVGVFGGILGGYLFQILGSAAAFDFTEWDFVAAVLGSLFALGVYRGGLRFRHGT